MRPITLHLVAAALVLTAGSSVRSEEAAPLRLTQTIPLEGVGGRIDHLGVDLDGGRLFVAALGNNSLEVIDLATGKGIQSISGLKEPQGVAVVAETRQVVVAGGGDSTCRIYDRALNPPSVIERLDDADNVRFCPSDKRIYVGYSNALAVIDPAKAVVVDRINLDGHPESFQIEAKGTRIFVNVPTAGHVAVVDRDAKKVVAKWPLAHARSNYPLALDETGHRLFVGCRWPAVTVVLDTETGKQVARLDCCGDTDDIFYDAVGRRLYVVGGEGCISVYHQDDSDHYSPMPKVFTASGARTALFASQTGLLYVAVPRRHGQNAEIRVFARGPGPLP